MLGPEGQAGRAGSLDSGSRVLGDLAALKQAESLWDLQFSKGPLCPPQGTSVPPQRTSVPPQGTSVPPQLLSQGVSLFTSVLVGPLLYQALVLRAYLPLVSPQHLSDPASVTQPQSHRSWIIYSLVPRGHGRGSARGRKMPRVPWLASWWALRARA